MATLDVEVDPRAAVDATNKLRQRAGDAYGQVSFWVLNYIQRNHLRGGGPPLPSRNLSPDKLRVPSGTLIKQTVRRPVNVTGQRITAPIYFGAPYAGYHISESQRSTTRIHRRTGRSTTRRTRIHTNDIFLRTREKMLGVLERYLLA